MIDSGAVCNLITCNLQHHLQINNKKNMNTNSLQKNKLNVILLPKKPKIIFPIKTTFKIFFFFNVVDMVDFYLIFKRF